LWRGYASDRTERDGDVLPRRVDGIDRADVLVHVLTGACLDVPHVHSTDFDLYGQPRAYRDMDGKPGSVKRLGTGRLSWLMPAVTEPDLGTPCHAVQNRTPPSGACLANGST